MTSPSVDLQRAWLALCAALGLHVFDEAMTGFLDVYNPTVLKIRESVAWFPMPVFTFDVWLGGLIAAVLLLTALSVFVRRGARWIRPIAYVFGGIMVANAIGHTLGTLFGRTVADVHFPRPMPGFYSSPLMFAAGVYLIVKLRATRTRARA